MYEVSLYKKGGVRSFIPRLLRKERESIALMSEHGLLAAAVTYMCTYSPHILSKKYVRRQTVYALCTYRENEASNEERKEGRKEAET